MDSWDDHEARYSDIMTNGKEDYENAIRKFVDIRIKHEIGDDIFAKYGLGFLLEGFNEN